MKILNFKRILVIMILSLVTITSSAEVLKFRTKAYSQRESTPYGWTSWTNWEKSDILITMDLNTDIVTIFSPRIQKYYIFGYSEPYYDHMARCIDYNFYDQDGDKGTMSLVVKPDGQSEIYIRFANVQWVYIVVRR